MKNGSNSLRGRLPAQFAIKSQILVSADGTDMVPKAAPASESLLHQSGMGMEREGKGGTGPGGCRAAEKKEKGKEKGERRKGKRERGKEKEDREKMKGKDTGKRK